MWYNLLADLVVAVHLGYMAYVIVGQLLIVIGVLARWSWVRNFWFRVTHLGAILIVAVETLVRVECPLTTLERWLRGSHEHTTFIGRLLDRALFYSPDEVSPFILDTSYLLFALLVLVTYYLAPPRWAAHKRSGAA